MSLPLWAATRDRAWSRRLAELCGQGWVFSVFPDPGALLKAAAGVEPGAALVDWELAGGDLPSLRRGLEGWGLFLVGKGKALSAPELSRAIGAGADGFLPKDISENALRAKLAFFRTRLSHSAPLEAGGVRLDRERRRVYLKAGARWKELKDLSPKEFELLGALLKYAGAVLDRRLLIESVWDGRLGEVNVETVDKHVESLRRKLGPAGKAIKTARGLGYFFSA